MFNRLLVLGLILSAFGNATALQSSAQDKSSIACISPLPVAHSNNAVAQTDIMGKQHIFSFAGLRDGKSWRDTSSQGYELIVGEKNWRALPDLPINAGILAASAQAVGSRVYIFGGYTIAEDGSERSTSQTLIYDPVEKSYSFGRAIPHPVDDSVSFVYQERYIYLVSGWHNDGNVRDVQIYDTLDDVWHKGTDYPGTPVFGHAGGIVGNRFVIADGVAVVGESESGKKIFDTVNEGWIGIIDPDDPTHITYQRLPQLPGRGHYRMAGAGDERRNQVLFMGGTPTAYNYDGIGYDGTPASAKAHVFAWDFTKDQWRAMRDKPMPSMDHRGMVRVDDIWWSIGGMDGDRNVIAEAYPERALVCTD